MLDLPAGYRARETRRQVFLRAMIRAGRQPSPICVRNISSRGMLLQAACPPQRGTYVEILLGRHVIVARVVWAKERRFGVQTRQAMDVDAILGELGAAPVRSRQAISAAMATPARAPTAAELRERHERNRRISSMFEFLVLVLAAGIIAVLAGEAIYARIGTTFERVENQL